MTMRRLRLTFCAAVVSCAVAASAEAAGPRNPYSGFNLSGINYGAQQWERAQQQGRRVWPYYNQPSGNYRGGTVSAGGFGGGGIGGVVVSGGGSRSSPRAARRWRR